MRLDEPDGSWVAVAGVIAEPHSEGITVYNFEVQSDHTYFVDDGLQDQIPVWVHNTCAGQPLPLAPESQGAFNLTARFENVPPSVWADFPEGVPRPTGPINLLEGEAYEAARLAANRFNQSLSRRFGVGPANYEIHEIVPVKFGGSATALSNKVGLLDTLHGEVTTWFGRLQRLIEG